MNSLISKTFETLSSKKKKAIIPFLTANFPNRSVFLELLYALPDEGAHIIEIGIPFSDPMADGKVIQKTSEIALKQQFNLNQCLQDIAGFKKTHPTIPIVIMTYINPLIKFGIHEFLSSAENVGVDGLLMVDVPAENHEKIIKRPTQLDMIRLVTPTTNSDRLPIIQDHSSGFIYYVSVKGITGSQVPNPDVVQAHLNVISSQLHLPMVIGFGISSISIAKQMAAIADGIVIGSSFLKPFLDSSSTLPNIVKQQLSFIRSISSAINHE
mgnify:CR=1 FL=1